MQETVKQHERDLQRHRVAQAEAAKLLKQMHEQFKKVTNQSRVEHVPPPILQPCPPTGSGGAGAGPPAAAQLGAEREQEGHGPPTEKTANGDGQSTHTPARATT